jgi:hypothetical protein
MKSLLAAIALLSVAVLNNVATDAAAATRNDQVTIAVFGDWP